MSDTPDTLDDLQELQQRLMGNAPSLVKPRRDVNHSDVLDRVAEDSRPSVPKKTQLEWDIEKLLKAQGKAGQSKNHYRKATLAQLQKELADRMSEAAAPSTPSTPSKAPTPPPPKNVHFAEQFNTELEFQPSEPGELRDPEEGEEDFSEAPMAWGNDVLGATLFQLNQVLAKTAEAVSVHFTDDLGTSLTGFSDDLQSKEEELTEVLLELYYEHHDTIAPMMTPLAKYGIIMGSSASTVAIANARKAAKNE